MSTDKIRADLQKLFATSQADVVLPTLLVGFEKSGDLALVRDFAKQNGLGLFEKFGPKARMVLLGGAKRPVIEMLAQQSYIRFIDVNYTG